MKPPDNALRYGRKGEPPPSPEVAVLIPDLYVGVDENGFLRVYMFQEPATNATATKEPNPCN